MARSDIAGADGHGVFRLPQYIRRIQKGGLNTKPDIVVHRTAPGTALVDGDNGLGSLVVARAVETAISIIAREQESRLGRDAARQPCRRRCGSMPRCRSSTT